MHLRQRLLLALLFASALLSSCASGSREERALRQNDAAVRQAWMERRTQELETLGLSHPDAVRKASEEWEHLGGESDRHLLFDSEAQKRADQEKLARDMEDLQRSK